MYKSQHIITLKHYLILFVIAFALGIYTAAAFELINLIFILLFSAFVFSILGTILLILIFTKPKRKRMKPCLLPLFIIFSFFLGTIRVFISDAIASDKLDLLKNQSVWTSGIITSKPTKTSSSYSFSMEFLLCKINDESIKPETIILYVPKNQGKHLREGDKICCWTTLKVPNRKSDFDNYDYFTHLKGKDIILTGATQNINPQEFEPPNSITYHLKAVGLFVKNKIVFAIDEILYDNPKLATILKGIIVGDKSEFSDGLYKKFSYAGLSHIAAVSGMHLSILFSLLTFLLLKMPISHKKSYIISLPFLALFIAAANFTPSVCRAALMMLIMMISSFFGQKYSPLNALFISLAIILWLRPYAIFSKSLSLSFGATFGILVLLKYFIAISPRKIHFADSLPEKLAFVSNKGLNFFVLSLATSFSAFLGIAYFSALFFESISIVQLFTNLWVIPTVSATFFLGFAAIITFYISPYLATSVFYYPLRFFLGIIYKTANIFGKREFAVHIPKSTLNFATFILYAGIFIFVYFLIKALYDIKKEKSDRL